MTMDIDSVRPPVISKTTCKMLDEYRGFRHGGMKKIGTLNAILKDVCRHFDMDRNTLINQLF